MDDRNRELRCRLTGRWSCPVHGERAARGRIHPRPGRVLRSAGRRPPRTRPARRATSPPRRLASCSIRRGWHRQRGGSRCSARGPVAGGDGGDHGDVLRRPVRYQRIPIEALEEQLARPWRLGSGHRWHARDVLAKTRGWTVPRTPEGTTPTSFRTWCRGPGPPSALSVAGTAAPRPRPSSGRARPACRRVRLGAHHRVEALQRDAAAALDRPALAQRRGQHRHDLAQRPQVGGQDPVADAGHQPAEVVQDDLRRVPRQRARRVVLDHQQQLVAPLSIPKKAALRLVVAPPTWWTTADGS